MVIYIIIAILTLVVTFFIMRNKEGYYSGYYYFTGGNGDKCTIEDGIITCKEKGIFPAWFYPSYHGYGYYPSHYRRPGYRYRKMNGRLYRYNH